MSRGTERNSLWRQTVGGAASPRCATCGEVTSVVQVARVGMTVDMGPALGAKLNPQQSRLETSSAQVGEGAPATLDAVQALIDQGNVHPLASGKSAGHCRR